MWCWGDVAWLMNGGTALDSAYATPVTSNGSTPLDRVVQASMSRYFSCAVIKKDTTREVWCWGSNEHANLGQGDKMARRYPTKVPGLTDPSLVRVVGNGASGTFGGTACAIDGNQVRCWGSNETGVAGVGSTTDPILTPTAVVLQGGATTLAGADGLESTLGGGGSFCAHTSTNALFCWGNSFMSYAGNYGVTGVVGQGGFYRPNPSSAAPANPRYLTSDGVYHIGMTTVPFDCGM
jgi:hypothetical protein